jgi:hypothetical protein
VERRWAAASAIAGVVVLALAALSALAPPPPACGDLAAGYPPIIAFELARDAADLAAIFGAAPGPCRAAMVAAMDTANVIDVAAFIPAYAVLLAAWFASRRRDAAGWARAGVAITLIAAVADVLENVCLFALTPELDPASPWLARLIPITAVKWLALGGAAVASAAVLLRASAPARTRAATAGAILCLAAPIATVGAVAAPATFGPLVTPAVAVAWLVCLVSAATRARARATARR